LTGHLSPHARKRWLLHLYITTSVTSTMFGESQQLANPLFPSYDGFWGEKTVRLPWVG